MQTKILSVLVAALTVACAGDSTGPKPSSEFAAAPAKITVAGVDLTLDTYLYRDFAPITPENGRPLIAGVRLKAADGAALPADLRAETFHVVYGEQVWTPELVQEWPATDPGEMELVARDGPLTLIAFARSLRFGAQDRKVLQGHALASHADRAQISPSRRTSKSPVSQGSKANGVFGTQRVFRTDGGSSHSKSPAPCH
jgi:hypothetical protein